MELNPNYARAYKNRGIAYYLSGDKVGACLDWLKASSLGETNAKKLYDMYCK
ncbi:MAG: hypothetical protein N2490_05065 [Ignavibacteria bacterium]|nr:hypothetical protein [Ignavibacteria bacterium]